MSPRLAFLLILLLTPPLRAADAPATPKPAATLPTLPPPAQAPWRTFALGQDHGDLLLRAPTTWDYVVQYPVPGLPPTLAFSTGQGKRFSLQITPLWPPKNAKAAAPPSPEKLRASMDARRKMMLEGAKEKSVDLLELKGDHAAGYYFTVTDKAPKPGEFECMTSVAATTGELLISATILHHAKDTPERTAALEALKSATHRPAPKQAAANENNRGATPLLRIPSPIPAAGDLVLPVPDNVQIVEHHYSAARRVTEVMATDAEGGLTISVWMEPAVKPGGDAAAVRALYFGRLQKSPIPMTDVKQAKSGDNATVEYTVADLKQKHLNVYAAKSGVWADVHYSKIDFTDKDQPLFTAAPTTVKFEPPTPTTAPAK